MSCYKFRELFLSSVLMLFNDQTPQGDYNRKNTWKITAGCMDTKTVLNCDFPGMMGYSFLPSCTLSNLDWNKITGVGSVLCSANSGEPLHKVPRVVVWSDTCVVLVSLAHMPRGECRHRRGKKIGVSWRKAERKSTLFLSILCEIAWKQFNAIFKWVW